MYSFQMAEGLTVEFTEADYSQETLPGMKVAPATTSSSSLLPALLTNAATRLVTRV